MTTLHSPAWREFAIEESGSQRGQCECCGTTTKRVWGVVNRHGDQMAAYFVSWTQGRPDHGAKFDLILGKWGHSTAKEDRYSVALDLRLIDGIPQFMVVDSVGRVTSGSPLVGTALNRADVIGTPLAPQVYSIVDAVYMSDALSEVRQWNDR